MKKYNALISVSDKTGVVEFAGEISKIGYSIYATGGTAKLLLENKIPVIEISSYTGFEEILDGRVKTLHPKIFGGILARKSSEAHTKQIQKHGIVPFDMVVVNLYPFEKVVLEPEVKEERIVENIDIGGVALIRAAAKNFSDVVVVVDSNDYNIVLDKIKNKSLDINFRKYLAQKAFFHTSRYDSIIANWFLSGLKSQYLVEDKIFLEEFTLGLKKVASLRYGENPHQRAALYGFPKYKPENYTLVESEKIQGKELSYNNYLDINSAYEIVKMFDGSACAIVKHNNPCGVAEANTICDAYKKALSCDPVSAFGGVVAFNREVDADTAQEVVKIFTECVIAPAFTPRAKEIFSKKKDLRLIILPLKNKSSSTELEFRQIDGGMLVQTRDNSCGIVNYKIVTKREPTPQELESLKFANIVVKQVKSNAIVLVRNKQTVGIGAGQMSRIDALRIAEIKMGQVDKEVLEQLKAYPLVLSSDAFFPFGDVVEYASKIGVSAIVQPGGSIRDEESIKAADKAGIAMIFTGTRHFKH